MNKNELDEKIIHTLIRYECSLAKREDLKYIGEPIKRVRSAVISIIKQAVFESLEYCDVYDYKTDDMPSNDRKSKFVLLEDARALLEEKNKKEMPYVECGNEC